MLEARALALEVLAKCQADRTPSDPLLAPRLARSGLSDRDRRFLTALVRTTHRWRGRADRVLDRRLTRGVRSLDLQTLNILRMGYIQLFHLEQIPPHAAVHTSVDLARRKATDGKARLVNSVLRGLISRRPAPEEWCSGSQAEAFEGELSHPAWLVQRWIEHWGEGETRRICEWNNSSPDLHLRVCGGPQGRERVSKQFEKEGRTIHPGEVLEETLRVDGSFPVGSHPLLKKGMLSLQDESQTIIGHLWPDPNQGPVLDLCAAPGTKSSHLAELSPGVTIVAADLTYRRAVRVAKTKGRLGLPRILPIVADGRRIPFRGAFPRVLVDAPCSGLGVLRRRPDARWLRSPVEIAAAATLQRQLIDAAWEVVADGGWLLYSVCSLEPEETEQQVSGLLERHPECKACPIPDGLPAQLRATPGVLRIHPGVMGMEGVFGALFVKAQGQGG